MSIHLYRAVALEEIVNDWTEQVDVYVGQSLGRSSGYLSRSGAKAAGERAGIRYVIVKSAPITFPTSPEVERIELEQEIAELRARLAEVAS